MIKNLGNFSAALKEFQSDNNNAVSYVYNQGLKAQQTENKLLENAVFSIKDVFATPDQTQASSLSLKDFNPGYTATVVQKALAAGAIAVGKNHCDELALGGEGIFSYWGVIKNPLDPTRKVGGSSSGSAATLTKNLTFAIGSDTGDSVRLPASYVGVVGFKPSYGAISRYGMFPYASSLDTVAFFSHNINDLSKICQATFGVDAADLTTVPVAINNVNLVKPQKVALLNFAKTNLSDFVYQKYFELKNNLEQAGVEVTLVEPNVKLLTAVKVVYQIVSFSEATSNLSNITGIPFGNRQNGKNWEEILTNTRSAGFGKMVQKRLILGSYFLNEENQHEFFLKAQKVRRLLKEYAEELHKKYDLVVIPATPDVAPLFDEKTNYGYTEYILTWSNLVGNPSLSIPWIKNSQINNLPINLSLDVEIYEDEKLLSYALWFEKFLGGENV
ncbi:amidase family protein [Candidatus Mycoplasma pogonae]